MKTLEKISLLGEDGKTVEYVRADALPEIEKINGSPVGYYCIVRCKDAGVWAGTVESKDGRDVHLLNARRLWYWKAIKGHTLSAVANYGVNDESKVPAKVNQVFLTEACELIPATRDSELSISKLKEYNDE